MNELIESKYSGYYIVPGIESIAISKEYKIISLVTGKELKIIKRNHGYLSVNQKISINGIKRHYQYLLHRVIALTFLSIPEKLLNYNIKKLQVNHIDGNKINNDLNNLEWCLPRENMRHAFNEKLIDIAVPVLAKDIFTNEIIKFKSIRECGEYFDISTISLRRNFNSTNNGILNIDGYVFKIDDDSDWPLLLEHHLIKNTWYLNRVVVAFNKLENKIYLFESLRNFCSGFKLPYSSVKYGKIVENNYRYNEWDIEIRDSLSGLDFSNFIISKKDIKSKDNKKYKIINTETGETTIIVSSKNAAKYIDYDRGYLTDYLNKGKNRFGVYDIYII